MQNIRRSPPKRNKKEWRVIAGEHLQLVTDVPSSHAVDELPAVFDAALAPWCEFFEMAPRGKEGELDGILDARPGVV